MRDDSSATPDESGPITTGGPLVHVLSSVPVQINGGTGIVGIVDCSALTINGETVVQASRHLYAYQMVSAHDTLAVTDPVTLPAELGDTVRCTLAYRAGLNPLISCSCPQHSGSPTTATVTVDARTLTVHPGPTA